MRLIELGSHLRYAATVLGGRALGSPSARPYLLGVVLTDRCNLDCHYCETRNNGKLHFSAGEAIAALEAARGRGCRALYFTGGEPTLWTDGGLGLDDLVAHARRIGFHQVLVYTNGTQPLTIEECGYVVTLDGPREVHDRIRGGSFARIVENVRRSRSRRVLCSITFTRENAPHVERFVKETAALGLFQGIGFNLLTHLPEVVAEHGVRGEDRRRLLDELWRLRRAGYPILLSRAGYRALRENRWRRPLPQVELATRERVYTCCRDGEKPDVCAECGYAFCAELAAVLALRPSAILAMLRLMG